MSDILLIQPPQWYPVSPYLAVPLLAFAFLGGDINAGLTVAGVDSATFLNVFASGSTGKFSAIEIISQLAWGLGYMGMPHILVRFMAVKNEKELNKSKVIAIIWVALSLLFAVIIGGFGALIYFSRK